MTRYIAATVLLLATATVVNAHIDPPPADTGEVATFVYHDSELRQHLWVRFLSNRKITFRLKLDEDCHKTVSGTAIRHSNEYSIDADEAGTLYPSWEYIYHGKATHTLYIRIAAKTKSYRANKAYVFETGDRSECPVSEQMMRLVPTRTTQTSRRQPADPHSR